MREPRLRDVRKLAQVIELVINLRKKTKQGSEGFLNYLFLEPSGILVKPVETISEYYFELHIDNIILQRK